MAHENYAINERERERERVEAPSKNSKPKIRSKFLVPSLFIAGILSIVIFAGIVKASTVPSTPLYLGAVAQNNQASLYWQVPSSDGGSSIIDYFVEYKLTSGSSWLTFNDGISVATTTNVTGLTNGTSYDLRVSAVNSQGTSTPSTVATVTSGDLGVGPFTVEDLGAPISLTTQERIMMYRTNNTHRHLQLYWDTAVNESGAILPDDLVDIDVENGVVATSSLTGGNLFRPGFHCNIFYPANNKTYIGGTGFFEFDPTTGTSRFIHNIDYHFCEYAEVGADGWIYLGGITSSAHVAAGLNRYNPMTDTWQDLGVIDPGYPSNSPTGANQQFAYTLGIDSNYIYVGLGQNPWYLAVIDKSNFSAPPALYWENEGDTYDYILNGTDGNLYFRRQNPAFTKTYSLANGVPTETTSYPTFTSYRANVVDDSSLFPSSTYFNTHINLDNANPNSGNGNQAVIGWQTDSNAWQWATTTGFSLAPTVIKHLYVSPSDPSKLFGWADNYGPVFTYATSTATVQTLGYPLYSIYDALFSGTSTYLSGYTSATLRYDNTKAWTLSASTPNRYSTSVNPYLLTVGGSDAGGNWDGKYHYYSALGSDGYIYIGTQHIRDSNGSGLGWYNSVDGTSNGLRQSFLNYDMRDLIAVASGTKMVASLGDNTSTNDKLFVLDVASKTIERQITPISGSNSIDKIIETEPGIVFGIAGTQFFKVNALTGDIIYVKNLGGTAFNYMYQYDHRLVKGPDGYIWLFINNVLSRINPKDGTIQTVLNSGLTASLMTFSGNTLYLYNGLVGTTAITHIKRISNLFTTTASISGTSFADAATGNYNVGATWGHTCSGSCPEGTYYPGPHDSASISSHTVTLTGDQNVGSTTLSATGILALGSHALNVYNNFISTSTGTLRIQGP